MDDYNTSMLSEAKNEYCVRLLNILTPLVIEGIKSILKEADQLCIQNDEESKYLMTFQNFLSRVPKWNNDIISEEKINGTNENFGVQHECRKSENEQETLYNFG